jgi:hypothetical protein
MDVDVSVDDRIMLVMLNEDGPDGGPLVLVQGEVEFMEAVRVAAAILKPLAKVAPGILKASVFEVIRQIEDDDQDCETCAYREVCLENVNDEGAAEAEVEGVN